MTENEKEMYIQKLKTEIGEYENREATYEAKRRELLEIEHAFRSINNRGAADGKQESEKDKTQEVITDGLSGQLADFDRKHRLQDGAKNDLVDKLKAIDDTMAERDAEIQDLN